jgi:hypothetical protein
MTQPMTDLTRLSDDQLSDLANAIDEDDFMFDAVAAELDARAAECELSPIPYDLF